jgi:hypothetical protein
MYTSSNKKKLFYSREHAPGCPDEIIPLHLW